MKKRGFTLAEILITLGIVGVVAALTAPALVMSSRNEANAAKLSVTVSNLENAFTSMLVKENVDSLFSTSAWGQVSNRAGFAGNIGQYLHTNGFRDSTAKEYYGGEYPHLMNTSGGDLGADEKNVLSNLDVAANNNAGTNHVIELKNGTTVFIVPNTSQAPTEATKRAIINAGGSLFNEAADVFIDVNGVNSPNILGRDIFAFYLGDDGILYPVGGVDVAALDSSGSKDGISTTDVWNSASAKTRSCLNGNIQAGGWGCTARVIAEGYKINY